MKIKLVFPRYKYPSGDPPLGLAYLASYLRENSDDEVEILDTTFDKSKATLVSKLKKGDYDLLGIYSNTTFIKDALQIAETSKRLNPNKKVIMGGPFATVMPEETLENRHVDAVAVGEGELTLYSLIKNSLNFKRVKGIWFKDGNKIRINPRRKPIKNLDSIPFPARDLLPMKKYIKNWFQLDSVSLGLRGTHIIGSRGCPYNCTFCQPTLRELFGPRIRYRSPKNIVEELLQLKKIYKINSFTFEDDTFIINQKWVVEICKRLIEENLDLLWGCNVRANLVNESLLKKMKKAGLVKVYIGIESLSQRILDTVYDKRITINQVKKSIRIAKRLGLKTQGYFMLGAPTETLKEIRATIKFAKNSDLDEAMFSIATPIPGTHLYEKTKGLIEADLDSFDYYKNYVFKSSPNRKKLIMWLKKRAYLEFYLSAKRLPQTIKIFNPFVMGRSMNKLKRF